MNVGRIGALVHALTEMARLSLPLDPGVRLYGRIKSVASISNKMSSKGIGANQVLDIIGARVVTQRVRDCYEIIERIHGEFEAIEHEYDDYIATPKPNGYQSLHTTVISPWRVPVEIQIRTHWMHQLCEMGLAAHAQYKQDHIAWTAFSSSTLASGRVA